MSDRYRLRLLGILSIRNSFLSSGILLLLGHIEGGEEGEIAHTPYGVVLNKISIKTKQFGLRHLLGIRHVVFPWPSSLATFSHLGSQPEAGIKRRTQPPLCGTRNSLTSFAGDPTDGQK